MHPTETDNTSRAGRREGLAVLVVDDEPLARARMVAMLEAVAEVGTIAEAAHGQACIDSAKQQHYDLVLLDIEMPGLSGLETAAQLGRLAQPPVVIFCTAYDQFAIEAFEHSALDYLLKPVSRERLAVSLQRVLAQRPPLATSLANSVADSPSTVRPESGDDYISVGNSRGRQRLALSSVRLLRADAKYVTAVTDRGEQLLEGSLKSWEARLGDQFIRVHRATLVAVRHFAGWEKNSDGQVVALLEGVAERPPISRRHFAAVQQRFRAERG